MSGLGVIYKRKSKEDEGHSLPQQEVHSLAMAERDGVTIPEEYIFEDRDKSAYKEGTVRPGFDKMMETIRKDSHITSIYCWRRDRIWRNRNEMEEFYVTIDALGVSINYYGDADRQDITTAHGWFMENMLMLLPEFESRLIGERTKQGIEGAKVEGVFTGRTPKFFRREEDGSITPTEDAYEMRELFNEEWGEPIIGRKFGVSARQVRRTLLIFSKWESAQKK